MTVLVDTNVLIDLLEEDPQWFEWSKSKLEFHGQNDTLAINQLVLAEVSIEFSSEEALNSALPPHFFQRLDLPWSAAFIAGRRFLEYRRRGGTRLIPLPDFYIGAHAMVCGSALLTRDSAFYRTNFPEVQLIAP